MNHLSTLTAVHKNGSKLNRFLASHRKKLSPLLILMHDYPDPDSLASAVALKYLCERVYGIQARIVYEGVIGRVENRAMVNILKIPINKLRRKDFKKYSRVALVDTQPAFNNNPFPKNRRATLIIDQHPFDVKPLADLAIVNQQSGATAVILAQALLLKKVQIPKDIATALVYGILTDTLNLYRAKQTDIVKTYISLLAFCDMQDLARIQNPPHTRKFFVTLGRGIKKAVSARRLMISHLGEVENPELISQSADILLTYKNVNWAFCTGRYKGKLYVSLRTKSVNVEAGEVLRDIFANRAQAGGHRTIAGGSFEVGQRVRESVWHLAEQQLQQKLQKRLRIPKKVVFRHPFHEWNSPGKPGVTS